MSTVRDDAVSGEESAAAQTQLYPALPEGTPTLHAVLLAPPHVPRWLADLVALTRGGRSVQVSVVMIEDGAPARDAPPLPLDIRLFLALERLRHRDFGEHLGAIDLGALACARVHFTDRADAVATAISALRPDLVLLHGPPEWHRALAAVAPQGCWQIDANLLDPRVAGLSLLHPVLAGDQVSAVDLELVDDAGSRIVLASSVGTTHPGSWRLQREHAFAKLSAMLLRSLRQLSRGELALPGTGARHLQLPRGAPFRFGSGIRALRTTLRHTLRWQIQKRRPEDLWLLLLRHGRQPLDPAAPGIEACSLLLAPRTDYWADPCVIEHDGRRLIFAEEYPARTHRAVIVCIELLPDGRAERLGIALDQTCHLSYPQVFEWQDQCYLTVESATARCVRLYRASDFPLRWQPVTDLVSDRVCVDPTLHFHAGHWYLFVNISESGGSTSEELFLFVSEQLTGPYRPHPANPIVSDVRRARPAGRLFEHQGRLIRPGQDCAPSYGTAIAFSEVLELTPERYRERPLGRLDGSWSHTLDGCHTYSAASSIEVLDARGRVPRELHRLEVVHASIQTRASEREVPLVSVLMIAEGAAPWLEQAIENVLAQRFADHEILIASDDPSATLLQVEPFLAGRSGRLRVIQVASCSVVAARDAVMAQARGRYLAWYESGYHWTPQHLEVCIERLERDAALGMVHAQVLAPEAPGTLFGRPLAREHVAPEVADPYAALLLWQSHPVTAGVVARRSTALTVGGFDGCFACRAHSERDYWLRIAAIADVGTVASGHLLPCGSRARGDFDADAIWRSRQMLVAKHVRTTHGRRWARQAMAMIEADRAVGCAAHAGFWVTLSAFARALRHNPLRLRLWQDLLRWALHMPRTDDGAPT